MNEKKKVLVVDDAIENLQILVQLLKNRYSVVVAKTAEGVFELLSRGSLPDIILLDVVLPDINGFEICSRIKADERTEHIPVIFISGCEELLVSDKIGKTGAVGFLKKPIEINELYSAIQQYI